MPKVSSHELIDSVLYDDEGETLQLSLVQSPQHQWFRLRLMTLGSKIYTPV